VRVWGSEFVLCLREFVVGLGIECLLCEGQFVGGLRRVSVCCVRAE